MDTSLFKKPIINDFNAFIEMKAQASTHKEETLSKAAKQFEAIFMQKMLKSMREANHFLSEDSPLRSKQAESFQDMLDQQRSLDVTASDRGIGLADMIVRQLDTAKLAEQYKGRGIERSGMNLPGSIVDKVVSHISQRSSMVMTPKDFVSALWPAAKAFAKELGVDPKLLIAQAIHETGWGQQMVKDSNGDSTLNLFNIKATGSWQNDQASTLTTEYVDGKAVKLKQPFRQYDSIEASFKDYVNLIKHSERYAKALSFSSDPQKYMTHLQQAGYATDPNYADKVLSIYEGDRFTNLMTDMENK